MTAQGKILVTITSAPEEGAATCLEEDCKPPHFLLIANAIVESTDRSEISVVELRMVLPIRSAKTMLRGMLEGETEIVISGMSPVAGLH